MYVDEIMATFDSLPPSLRQAVASANQPWAPHWGALAGRYWDAPALVQRVVQADREEATRRELALLQGQG